MSIQSFTRRGAIALGFVAVAALVGCGEKRIPVFKVSGKVLFNGQPAAGAQVVLHPAAGSTAPGDLPPVATVADDGSFQIGAYEAADGAPQGEYVATIQWFRLVQTEGGTGKGPNVLPVKYSAPTTSPLQVKVETAAVDLQPWDVTR